MAELLKIDYEKITTEDEREKTRYHLYVVTLVLPHGTFTRYVLTDSEKAAIGMAECAEGFESYAMDPAIYALRKVMAVRVPLTIQGWGKRNY